ncbi:MAG: sigma factor-like helix-turn-helix DNA-binding protein [Nitrososphaerales archaeon]
MKGLGRGKYKRRRSQRFDVKKEEVVVLKESFKQFIKSLKDKELVIFRERLLADAPFTLREIGERHGITRERVRQIEERVKKKFKDLRGTRIGS